jgi:hypothetical protein
MPIYIYEHPNTGQQVEVAQRMTEEHKYVQDGVEWKRVFSNPTASVDTLSNLDPFDRKGFVQKTAKRGMKLGDMWDESKRLSDARAKKAGKDALREKVITDYKTKCHGKEHPFANS